MKTFLYQAVCCLALTLVGCSTADSDAVRPMAANTAAAAKAGELSVPTLSSIFVDKTYISVQVTAGATGAPAGFSLQWMPAAAYAAGGNVWNDALACKASFSGAASDSRYTLAADGSVVVNVGALVLDNGTSTSCASELTCGTAYAFRVFAHADKSAKRSDFSPVYTFYTRDCSGVPHEK